MKKRIVITAVIMVFVFLCSQAIAGSTSGRRLEGFLIGSGVTIIGAAMIGLLNDDDHRFKHRHKEDASRHHMKKKLADQLPHSFHIPPPEYRNKLEVIYASYHSRLPVDDHHRYKKRIWVDPVYEENWVPGYYNKRQQWVEGYHERVVVIQGYWKEAY